MGAFNMIERLAVAGVRLSVIDPNRLAAEPRGVLTDELRDLIRTNKEALIEALRPTDQGQELRRQRVLERLEAKPGKTRAAIFDTDADSDTVICTVAIRNVGTCGLRIPRDRYDMRLIQEAMGRSEVS